MELSTPYVPPSRAYEDTTPCSSDRRLTDQFHENSPRPGGAPVQFGSAFEHDRVPPRGHGG